MAAPVRILIVDDDPWIQRMASTILGKRGHTVVSAGDGQEGLERAASTHPDLVITDVLMPRMDGWSFVRELRMRPEFALTPVIFLTALSADNDRMRGFGLGADDYLPKPFRFEELEARVGRALARRAELAAEVKMPVSDVPTAELLLPIELTPAPVAIEPAAPASGAAPSGPATPERRRGEDEGEARRTVLHGDLTHIGLSSLLVILEMERKTGVLILQRRGELGRLFIRKGRVVRADQNAPPSATGEADAHHTGTAAVYALLRWSDGRFDFTRGEVEGEDEIHASTTYLLMEAARLMDESNADRAS